MEEEEEIKDVSLPQQPQDAAETVEKSAQNAMEPSGLQSGSVLFPETLIVPEGELQLTGPPPPAATAPVEEAGTTATTASTDVAAPAEASAPTVAAAALTDATAAADATAVVTERGTGTTTAPPTETAVPVGAVGGEMKEAEEAAATGRGGRRRRGRPVASARQRTRAPPKKKEEEDVCFICFDGGNLVLCDRRGCPKAYHPQCINRDEAFFRSKGRWNCGWHICSKCERAAHYMCYTCTFSLCKGCMRESGFLCVRGNKGLCETCMRTVNLIEKNGQLTSEMPAVDFDDKTSWEYLFKEYWLDLKRRISLTSEEVVRARNPLKGSGVLAREEESSDEWYDATGDLGSSSDSSFGHRETSSKKGKKRSRSIMNKENSSSAKQEVGSGGTSVPGSTEWASKELLEFVAFMKDGDKSVLSQFDVQNLLLDYITKNNLRDPRKKSQIICDSRLESLFGKPRVGHFEMLKLLESNFLIKENPPASEDGNQVGIIDSEVIQTEADGYSDPSKPGSDKRRKTRKKTEDRGALNNPDDYAAIDVHNINLIYLRRNLMEELIDDVDKFRDMVVGAFVKIRISGTGQKQDMYRLVQVVGTGKAKEAYKIGKKTTDITLEILNLDKTEPIAIDVISNQEFTEEECRRLRQSIRCGLINRLTVGEVQEKARALQAVRVNDWLETELLRLSHLRDRASEKGRKKEHRECVEKILLLNTPEERSRRLHEIPEVHADPNMDPSYVSDDEEGDPDDKKQDNNMRLRDAVFSRKGRDLISPGKGDTASTDGWNASWKGSTPNWDASRNMSPKGVGWDKSDIATAPGERTNNAWNQGREVPHTNNLEGMSLQAGAWNNQLMARSGPLSTALETATIPPSTVVAASSNTSETDKIWHYQDPAGKIQGPFSMTQLRKWSKTGYFPDDLKIWKASGKQEDSILLTDALIGKFQKEPQQWESQPQQRNFLQPQSSAALSDGRENSLMWMDKRQNGNTGLAKSEGQSYIWGGAAPINSTGGSSHSWDSSKGSNAWPSQVQSNSPRLTPSFSGQSYQIPSHQGREAQGGGNPGGWNSSPNHGNVNRTAGFQPNNPGSSVQSSGEVSKVQPESNPSKDWEMQSAVAPKFTVNDFSDPPTPTPKPAVGGWTVGQVGENLWSPTVQSSSAWGTTSGSGVNTPQQQPPVAANSNILVAGWDTNNSAASTLKPAETADWGAGQTSPKLLLEVLGAEQGGSHDSLDPPSPTPKANNVEGWTGSQGSTVSAASVQSTSSIWGNSLTLGGNGQQLSSSVASEPIKTGTVWGEQPSNPVKPSAGNTPERQQTTFPNVSSPLAHHPGMMVDFLSSDGNRQIPSQIVVTDEQHIVSHGKVEPEKKPQTLVPTTAENVMSVDGEGSGLPSATASCLPSSQALEVNWQALAPLSAEFLQPNLQNQAAFAFSESIQSSATAATLLSPDGWGPSGWNLVANPAVNSSQTNPSALLSGNPWNAGPVMDTSRVTGTTENQHPAWGWTPEGSNMGLVPQHGNANATWGTAPPQGSTNTGWGMMPQGNANASWMTSTMGNSNAVWGMTTHGNTNMGWDPSAGNSGMWGGSHHHAHISERFPSQGDRSVGRPSWAQQSSGGGGSSRLPPARGGSGGGGRGVCKFHESGYCKKGASCGYLHT